MKRVKEVEIQKWLEKEENYKNLSNLIQDSHLIENYKNNNMIPLYSLDYIVKNKIIDSAKYVYDNLYELELVVADKNISINKKEKLFPDLLLFNSETSTFIIVEIKRSGQAEREAITEILAYEHELQNLFPFMSKLEVCFVLISADYNTLLEHSLYSLSLWQNRKILPLKISGLEDYNSKKWNLSVHIPNSWSLLSTGYLKPEQISTVNLVLYDKDAYNKHISIKDKKDNFEVLLRGIELIVKEGEKNNSSGFVLLSKLTDSDLANWNITIGVLNPYSFFQLLEYESKVKQFFEKEYKDAIETKCRMELTVNAKKYLNIFYNSKFETFTTWNFSKKELQEISSPILIDFFGEFDNMVNEFVLNEDVREYYLNELNTGKIDWKHPTIGLNLLDNLLGNNIFFEGNFNFINIYEFGKILGTLNHYLHILKINKDNKGIAQFIGKYDWIELEFIKSYREVSTRYLETGDIVSDFIPFKKLVGETDINIQNVNSIINWFIEDFINDSNHKDAFYLGLTIKNYFCDNKQYMSKEDIFAIENLIIDTTKNKINKQFKNSTNEEFYGLKDEIKEYKEIFGLDNSFDFSKINKKFIIDNFEKYTLKLFSQSISPIIHKKAPFQSSNLNLNTLKEFYFMEYEKNDKCIIKLESNGLLVIIKPLLEMEILVSSYGKINPKKELLFWNNSIEITMITKLTWEEFEDMEF